MKNVNKKESSIKYFIDFPMFGQFQLEKDVPDDRSVESCELASHICNLSSAGKPLSF